MTHTQFYQSIVNQ